MYKAVLLLTGKCLARCCILDLLTRAFWFKFTMGNHGEWMDGWMNEWMNEWIHFSGICPFAEFVPEPISVI
jgi:hypothetical protein